VHHERSLVPSVFLRSLFDNLEFGKRSYCFGKSLEKVLNFGSKNLYEPCIIHSPQGFSGIIYNICWGTFTSETAFNAVYR